MKLVSVYINAYNAEKFILETVNSVLNQTYKNLQVIVVDDGSTDKTPEILASIDDSRLEVYRVEPNGHISNALNVGLSHAKGEYIAHTDADDLWAPDKIEKQIEYLEGNIDCGACVTHVKIIDEDSNEIVETSTNFVEVFNIENMSQAKMFRYFYDKANHICHSSFTARAELINKVGKYDLSMPYLHDFDYWMRTLCYTSIHIIEEPLTSYRVGISAQSNSTMTDAKWISHDTEYARVMEKAINLMPADVFCEAFADRLRLKGEHTSEEIEIEKALVMEDAILPLRSNKHLAINKFAQLFKEEKNVKIAKEKFDFSIHDFYKLQYVPSLYDSNKVEQKEREAKQIIDSLNNEIQSLNCNLNDLRGQLENQKQQTEEYKRNFNDTQMALQESLAINTRLSEDFNIIHNSLLDITNSFFWRITAPARKTVDFLKRILKK